MKKALVLGGGGFVGGHIAKRLKSEGYWVRVVDIKRHEYFDEKDNKFCERCWEELEGVFSKENKK